MKSTESTESAPETEPSGAATDDAGWVGRAKAKVQQKRTVCDHCRRRRIRCDGQSPCQQCNNARLICKREHVPRKRGPKRGHGRVINELRAREAQVRQRSSRESSADFEGMGESVGDPSSIPSSPPDSWTKPAQGYLHLIPQCVDLYYEHIYPTMPLLYMPSIREMIARPMGLSEKNLIYALCALTSMHMSGRNIQAQGPESWEEAGRFFLDECSLVRQSYDFLEDLSLYAVISSFWLSTSFFEINESRKSWFYLREALTLALDLGIHDDSTYSGLSSKEKLCRQRVFWILFVSERSFAVLRNKPLTLKKTPSLPTTRHHYESPDIHAGFLQLVSSYIPLDESFVTAWNDGSDPRVSGTTYLALQNLLAIPPEYLNRPSRATTPSTDSGGASLFPATATASSNPPHNANREAATTTGADAEAEAEPPVPTAVQKADLLITQQWLRLIVWQSSFRQGLLSWGAPHESMHFAFPLAVARRTASVLASLPPSAVEVHGMGIFEKIFEIGTWCINVLGACDGAAAGMGTQTEPGVISPSVSSGSLASLSSTSSSSQPGRRGSSAGIFGMDFAGGDDLGVLGMARKSPALDPLEFFVRTLSASPNSRVRFAERLLMFAGERPGGMRMALSPALTPAPVAWGFNGAREMTGPDGAAASGAAAGGSVLGEVVAEESNADAEMNFGMSGALGVGADQEAGLSLSEFGIPIPSVEVSADPVVDLGDLSDLDVDVDVDLDLDVGLISPTFSDGTFGAGLLCELAGAGMADTNTTGRGLHALVSGTSVPLSEWSDSEYKQGAIGGGFAEAYDLGDSGGSGFAAPRSDTLPRSTAGSGDLQHEPHHGLGIAGGRYQDDSNGEVLTGVQQQGEAIDTQGGQGGQDGTGYRKGSWRAWEL